MLFFVPTPIGNLADISLHALQIFHQCSVVLCEDTRVTKKLLTLLLRNPLIQAHFPNIAPDTKKFLSFHSHNQEAFLENITADFFLQNVAFCTDAGMPNISDPGTLLLEYARKHAIQYEVILGGGAFSHAFVCSGLESPFLFYGFLPHKQQERQVCLRQFSLYHDTTHIIVYESPKRLQESLRDIDSIFPTATLYLYKELTKLYETEIIGNASAIMQQLPSTIKGEYCIIIAKKECSNMLDSGDKKVLHLDEEGIMALSLPPKQKAKMLAQISTKSAKEWYAILTHNEIK